MARWLADCQDPDGLTLAGAKKDFSLQKNQIIMVAHHKKFVLSMKREHFTV